MLQSKPSNLVLFVGLAAGAVVIAACGSGSEGSKASGLFDEVKTKAAVSEKSHTETKPKTKRVCVAKNKKGVCTSYADRPDGTKQVKVIDRKAKPALYCVELDNVNGKPTRDDEWFEVSSTTYHKMADLDEGNKVTDMKYSVSGCSR